MKQSQQVLEWQAEAMAEGEARGEARGRVQALREVLQSLLEHRFGKLPEDLLTRINTTEDLSHLQNAINKGFDIQSLDELPL